MKNTKSMEEEEEDKELMKIRLETLQTMIGKLKKSSTASSNKTEKETGQRSSASNSVVNNRSSSLQCQKLTWSSGRHALSKHSTANRYKYTSSDVTRPSIETTMSFVNKATVATMPRTGTTKQSIKANIVATKTSVKANTITATGSRHKYIKPGFQTSSTHLLHVSTDKIVRKSAESAINTRHKLVNQHNVRQVTDNVIPKTSVSAISTRHKLVKPCDIRQQATVIYSKPTSVSTSGHTVHPIKQKHVIGKFSLVNVPVENQTVVPGHRKVPQRTTESSFSYRKTGSSLISKPSVSKYKVVNTIGGPLASSANSTSWTSLNNTQQLQPKATFTGGYTVLRRRFALIKNNSSTKQQQQKPFIHHEPKHLLYSSSYLNKSFATRRVKYLQRSAYTQTKPTAGKYASQRPSKSSPKKDLLLKRHGSNFVVSNNMKSLHKVHHNKSPALTQNTSLEAQSRNAVTSSKSKFRYLRSNSKTVNLTSAKQLVASKLLRKNIMFQQRKKVNKTKYCLFYNRFGKCKRGEDCRFIHDPNKVAVCTKFLRGTCTDDKCLLTHKVDPSKMPVCSYFLLSHCTRDNCPYRHVNVNKDAAICEDFLKGYCAEGDQCKKKHVLECPDYASTGKCVNRKTCVLLHKSAKKKRRRTISASGCRRPRAFSQKRVRLDDSRRTDVDVALLSPLRNKGSSHLLPKFINDKINEDRYESSKALSFSTVRNLFAVDTGSSAASEQSGDDAENQPGPSGLGAETGEEFIPLTMSSEDEGSDEDDETIETCARKFSLTEKDFISLE